MCTIIYLIYDQVNISHHGCGVHSQLLLLQFGSNHSRVRSVEFAKQELISDLHGIRTSWHNALQTKSFTVIVNSKGWVQPQPETLVGTVRSSHCGCYVLYIACVYLSEINETQSK